MPRLCWTCFVWLHASALDKMFFPWLPRNKRNLFNLFFAPQHRPFKTQCLRRYSMIWSPKHQSCWQGEKTYIVFNRQNCWIKNVYVCGLLVRSDHEYSDHCKSPWNFAGMLAEPLPVLGMGVRHWPSTTQSRKKQGCAMWCRWASLFWVKINAEICFT
jgi:hypothetical protein